MEKYTKMIMKTEFLKKLRSAFELNEYEVKIWVALLSKGVAAAGELSDTANVPRSRAYDVLESLEKKGFIIMKVGRPIRYLAVKPEDIVKRVKKDISFKAEEQVGNIDKIKGTEVYEELTLLFTNGITNVDPHSVSGSFKGRSNTYNHLMNLLEDANKEVIISTTDTGLIRKADYLRPALRKLKKTGVTVKIGAPIKSAKAKEAAKVLGEVAKVKSMDSNGRFVVVDGKEVVFMVNDDNKVHESSDVSIWVNTEFFAGALKSLFDAGWK